MNDDFSSDGTFRVAQFFSFSEEIGDSEPNEGEDLRSEAWSDVSLADSYDNDFIDSADEINELSSDDNNSTTNQLTRKRLFTARHLSSTNSNYLEPLHHESSYCGSNDFGVKS